MDGLDDLHSSRPSRRTLLSRIGAGVGAVLAGCTDLTADGNVDDGDDAQNRIKELEAQLAEAQKENAALNEQITKLESDLEGCQRRLETVNIWGFDQETIDRLQKLADTLTDSVVVIDAITEDGLWSIGTGWVYDDGIIASNAHVVEPRRLPDGYSITQYTVWDRMGQQTEGKLLGYTYGEDDIFDRREDIGFLEVPESMTEGRQMEQGVSRHLSTDEPLVQIGHPYSLEFWTAAAGPFIGHREPFFASNIPGQPGVSGSPIIDLSGEVVGMTWGGQYVRRQQRQIGDTPESGDGQVLMAFEKAMNGTHSYMNRIHTAADNLI